MKTIWSLEAMGPSSATWHPVAMTRNPDRREAIETKMKPKYHKECRWRWIIPTAESVQNFRSFGKSISN